MKAQVKRFRKGFPWLDIAAPAVPGHGIKVLTTEERDSAAAYADTAAVDGKCKFIPASGAASRMFKDIFAGMDTPNEATEKLAANLPGFAFYTPEVFGTAPFDAAESARRLLTADGLDYGSKPKGVLKFHRYPDEVRTALAEHFVEGQAYMRNSDGTVNMTVTISPEHRELFEQALAEIKDRYEARYGVKYNVRFTYQDKETDTVAVDKDGEPFRKDDGSILFRPAGHGALIYNLNRVEEELVSIKNIDNVCVERMQPETYLWKKVLMGKALELRDTIFAFIEDLDQCGAVRFFEPVGSIPGYNPPHYDPFATEECQKLCRDIEDFLWEEMSISVPATGTCEQRAMMLRSILDRPIRVCGMVRNQGEPGGGPFIIREKDGRTSLQILEGAQIDKNNPAAMEALAGATHFNPVDIVCCLRRHDGSRFDLLEYVDEETGLISSKSYQGRELRALELPGLWNGSMSDWNTMFVEVPIGTFNPVKTVLDLLRESHR